MNARLHPDLFGRSRATILMTWRLRRAAAVIANGGVIAHATEAVFGLAASAFDAAACARVARMKARRADQHFIVIAADISQLSGLVNLRTRFHEEIIAGWPGPHTWILPAVAGAPPWLRDGQARLAVRVTAHAQAAALCALTGPLISTSANPTGRPPAGTLSAARRYFGHAVDFYLPGEVGPQKRPSRIRDGDSGAVLRA